MTRIPAFVKPTLALICLVLSFASRAQSVDPGIAGHWVGGLTVGGVSVLSVTLDLQASATFSGTVSGEGFNGCSFSGSIPSSGIVVSAATGFSGLGTASMSGCSNSSLNTTYTAFINAASTSLNLLISAGSASGTIGFEANDMGRTGPANGGGGTSSTVSQQRAALTSMWYNPTESGWGMSLTIGTTAAQTTFVVLYLYSGSQPYWLVMPNGQWVSDWVLQGDLYATTGTDYQANWDSSRFTATKVGTFMLAVTGPTSASIQYFVKQPDGSTKSVSKDVVKQIF